MNEEIKKPELILPGDPIYPPIEDIYSKNKEDQNVDPEDISKKKLSTKHSNNVTESELDVPGAELDDAEENIGSEDEENNYYSIGGDEHNNLDDDRPE